MPERRKFRVYLAGPISHCNESQKRRWRETVKHEYEAKMTFLDPVENLLGPEASAYEVVAADIRLIERADGLLVNMWRESIGSALGVVHAFRQGRPVVAADPNHIESRVLAFFADAVEETPLQGAKALLNLLRAESDWRVMVKSEGREERFERRKILEAVRSACRQAKRDDVIIPRRVLPEVIEQLRASDRRMRKTVTTTDIDRAVENVLARLESDAVRAEAVSGILNAWRGRQDWKRSGAARVDAVRDRPPQDPVLAGRVPISSHKSHGTIWGSAVKSLDHLPSPDARKIFTTISSVSGITAIRLGQFGRKGSRTTCQAWVGDSPTPHVIAGKLYDKGPKGTVQGFQVHVQFDERKYEVIAKIIEALRRTDRWAG